LARNDLSGGNFAGQNFTNAALYAATLTGADFTGAQVQGANFDTYGGGTGLTPAQLYSTASYQAHDLTGIGLARNDLSGGNFAGQNLMNASLGSATLTGADLSHANLTNAYFGGATLTGADFTGADARGGSLSSFGLSMAITTNLIRPIGIMPGLDLGGGQQFLVRDYDGNPAKFPAGPPIPIRVNGHFLMGPGGVLQLAFEADAWDSLISFAPAIDVSLGGTLELLFAPDVNLASQVGRTIDLFDWTGVAPTGAFAVHSPYSWDLSKLYTTGEVTLTAVPEPTTGTMVVVLLLCCVCTTRRSLRAQRNRD
jgi:hypothetical protein